MGPAFWSNIKFNSLWKGAQLISMFFLNLAIARVFQAGRSGDFLFLLTNFQLLVTIVSLSADSAIQFYTATDPALVGSLSRLIFTYCLLVSALLAVIVGVAVCFHWMKPSISPVLFVLYAVGYMAGMVLFKFFAALGFGLRSVKVPILLEGAGNAVLLICLGVVYVSGASSGLFFPLYYAMPAVTGIVLYAYLKRTHAALFATGAAADDVGAVGTAWAAADRAGAAAPRLHFPSLLRYSGLSFGANLVFFLVYRMDYWWVAAYCSEKQLGNYIQASKLVQLFYYFPQLISTVIFPDVVQGMAFAGKVTIRKLLGYIFLIYVVCIGVVVVLGNWGLTWLLGPSFDEVFGTFLLLIPGIFALGGQAILSAYFAGLNQVSVNLKGALVGLFLMTVGDWIVIPRYHIAGAALVSSVAYLGSFAYSYARFHKSNALL
jgi:O-antigen/teichoic acid export membrane protein